MEETKVNFVPEKETKNSGKFQAKCFHCKDKETLTLDNGMKVDLPYKLVEIKKDKEMLKEFKGYMAESERKYANKRVIKRRLINGCPECGRTIDICCADYVECYTPKKKEDKKEGDNMNG